MQTKFLWWKCFNPNEPMSKLSFTTFFPKQEKFILKTSAHREVIIFISWEGPGLILGTLQNVFFASSSRVGMWMVWTLLIFHYDFSLLTFLHFIYYWDLILLATGDFSRKKSIIGEKKGRLWRTEWVYKVYIISCLPGLPLYAKKISRLSLPILV